MERARTDWLRAVGVEHEELKNADGTVFVVRSAQIEFLRPARLDDLLEVDASISEYGGASLTFAQHIRRDDTLLCEAKTLVACLNAETLAPRRLPAALLARLKEVIA